MIVPALIYTFFNYGNPLYSHGWAIPTATDIAFVLGVLALLGPRVPAGLRMFLLSLAIFDDIGAIIVIALFYSHDLSVTMLISSLICLAILFAFNRLGVRKLTPYMLVGLVMWLFVLKSGVHATLTGVALGLMIPHKGAKGRGIITLEAVRVRAASLCSLLYCAFICIRQCRRFLESLDRE